jgi:CheY-specific phosphatase CheX
MNAKFFGQYLLEKGKITAQQLVDAVESQKSVHTPLGALAIEKEMLTAGQVQKIHDEQKRTDRRFGELAVSMGIMTHPQLIELIVVQASRKVLLGEVLVSKGFVDLEELEKELRTYQQEQERISAEVSSFFNQVLHRDIVENFTDLAMKMFTRFVKQAMKIDLCEMGKDKVRLHDWAVAQKIQGDGVEFTSLLCVPTDFLLQMASSMLDQPITKENEVVIDAAKEFMNITNGNSCAKLSGYGLSLRMAPPEVYETAKNPYPVEKANEAVCVHLISPETSLDIAFEF